MKSLTPPNMDAAREAFAERVANAYRLTWHGFGFVGPEFSEERARELGQQAAQYAFPFPAAPMIVAADTLDPEWLRELANQTNPIMQMIPFRETFDAEYIYDGVVGD